MSKTNRNQFSKKSSQNQYDTQEWDEENLNYLEDISSEFGNLPQLQRWSMSSDGEE
jgi:hypothetical protein